MGVYLLWGKVQIMLIACALQQRNIGMNLLADPSNNMHQKSWLDLYTNFLIPICIYASVAYAFV